MTEIEKRWTKVATDALVGRKIVKVEYMSKENCKQLDWYESGLILVLDNNTFVIVQQDDEGNGPGSLVVQSMTSDITLPTINAEHVS